MLKSMKNIVKLDKVITNSNVRFLLFSNKGKKYRNSFFEVYYNQGRVLYKERNFAYIEKRRINNDLSIGICEGKIYFAHDYRFDNNCYFGYIMDIPKINEELICKTVIYEHSRLELKTKIIKNIESVEEIENTCDTYIIKSNGKIYVLKYLNVLL